MAHDSEYVWIYRYRFWDPERNEAVLSTRMATSEAIKSGLGIVAFETALKVPSGDVDEYGHYRDDRVGSAGPRGVER